MDGSMTKIIYFVSTRSTLSVHIPSTVREICPYSFLGSQYVIEVIFTRGNLEKVGFQSFMDCPKLKRLVFPLTLKIIDEQAFKNTHNIVCGGLQLPESLIQDARDAGMSELPLSRGCLNNFAALLRKKTCKVARRPSINSVLFNPLF